MASAYKCDRCGRLYPDIDTTVRFASSSGTYISRIWIGNQNWDSGAKDLCPNCARDLKVWWEHSNISAQYMLNKIESETQQKE